MLHQSPKQTAIARKLRKADTWAEKLLWGWLRDRRFSAYKFRRQVPMGPHILDFFCAEAKLNIELDGSQHGHPERLQADVERDAWLAERGIKVLRFWNARLRREKEVVRDAIWQALQERVPQPVPEYCRVGVVGKKPVERKGPVVEVASLSLTPSLSRWERGATQAASLILSRWERGGARGLAVFSGVFSYS